MVGYSPDGNKISKLDLLERAEISNQAIKEGKTKPIEQIREDMNKW
ncbi:hypothetical protein [Marivirga harenae]|nr:hypothetical protein [Marivirga harenae]WKV10761.1 hypothetical protein Q3Y49_11110 [Marivirga harenae]